MASYDKIRSVRCTQMKGHTGLCTPGSTRFEDDDLCSLSRRTMDLFEASACVVTHAEYWPELQDLPKDWSAVVDAEMDVVCHVPPHPQAKNPQQDSRVRAQIICDVLNTTQNEDLK